MLKVKGKYLRSWGVEGNPQDVLGDTLVEIELSPVNPEDLKEGQTVLVKCKIIQCGEAMLVSEAFWRNIVAILPAEKKEEVDFDGLDVPYGKEVNRHQFNKLRAIVEKLAKERK
jgi:hypothetical protein